MAVIVKYIVVRNGMEKMTFTSKKEADAYDKMLDIADNLFEFIESEGPAMDEKLLEELTLFIAENKEKATAILKGLKPREETRPPVKAKGKTPGQTSEEPAEVKTAKPRKDVDKTAKKKKKT